LKSSFCVSVVSIFPLDSEPTTHATSWTKGARSIPFAYSFNISIIVNLYSKINIFAKSYGENIEKSSSPFSECDLKKCDQSDLLNCCEGHICIRVTKTLNAVLEGDDTHDIRTEISQSSKPLGHRGRLYCNDVRRFGYIAVWENKLNNFDNNCSTYTRFHIIIIDYKNTSDGWKIRIFRINFFTLLKLKNLKQLIHNLNQFLAFLIMDSIKIDFNDVFFLLMSTRL